MTQVQTSAGESQPPWRPALGGERHDRNKSVVAASPDRDSAETGGLFVHPRRFLAPKGRERKLA